LVAQLAINPSCQGVRIIRTNHDDDFVKVREPHWWLTLDFALPNEQRQSWELTALEPGKVPQDFLDGEGDPGEIAAEICSIVKGRGGSSQ
jgi:hypothetical protein